MQFLFITKENLLSTAKRVMLEGNEVAVYDPLGGTAGEGYVPVVKELTLRPDTVVVFDYPGQGKLADSLRSSGWALVGGGVFNDRIEQDYRQAIALMRLATIPSGMARAVDTLQDGLTEMKQHPQLSVLRRASNRRDVVTYSVPGEGPFVVMEASVGPEEFFGGFFNGSDWVFGGFYSAVVERNFMTGGLGQDIGYAGGVSFFYKHARPAMVKATLIRLSRFLHQKNYRGPVGCWMVGDTAVGLSLSFEAGVWCGLQRLISGDLGRYFADLARGQTRKIRVSHDYSAGVLLSTSPFPGPIFGDPPVKIDPPTHMGLDFHPLDRSTGKVAYVTYQAGSVSGLPKIYDDVKKLDIPGLQYRTDLVSPAVQHRVRQLLRRVTVEKAVGLELPMEPPTPGEWRFMSRKEET